MPTDLLGDWDPLWCYALVLLAGALSAYWQVSDRFKPLPGAWSMAGTWLIMLAFTAIPVLLFFVLDRSGAIHDTSPFAALLIGFGYQQILSGQITSAKAPSDVSALLQPFVRWIEWMNGRIRDRIARNGTRFKEMLIDDVVDDSVKFERLRIVVLQHLVNPEKLVTDLAKAQQDLKNLKLSETIISRRIAEIIYAELLRIDDYQYLLVRERVISSFEFYSRTGRLRPLQIGIISIAALFLLFSFLPNGVSIRNFVAGQYPFWLTDFYSWRITQANATDADNYRTSEQLVAYMAEPGMVKPLCKELTSVLRYEPLTSKDAERILAVLLTANPPASACGSKLNDLLIDSLRTSNADVRARINDSLIWLYSDENPKKALPDDLKNWKPKSSEGPASIEQYISLWRRAWPAPPAAVAAASPTLASSSAAAPSVAAAAAAATARPAAERSSAASDRRRIDAMPPDARSPRQ